MGQENWRRRSRQVRTCRAVSVLHLRKLQSDRELLVRQSVVDFHVVDEPVDRERKCAARPAPVPLAQTGNSFLVFLMEYQVHDLVAGIKNARAAVCMRGS